MKNSFFAALAVAASLTACDNNAPMDAPTVPVRFFVQGDFSIANTPFTRSLTADGKDMTDVWVLDYVDGALVQQLHQTSEDDDFGTPTLSLSVGSHHIYFIASRGQGATLNTTDHTLTFTKVSDTFWKDYEINITAGTSNESRTVSLDRVVTKLKLVFSDAIPAGATTFNITPATWYYGINYTTGEPISATPSQPITVNIPSSEIGVIGETVSIFGFSSATEWTTNIAINCKAANNDVLGSATIAAAPFVRNRVSEYTGPLFGDSGAMTLSLNATWDDSYTGTW